MSEEPMFRSFGEWGAAVVRAAGGQLDPRFQRAPTGAGETIGVSGGFLVPETYAAKILGTIYEDRNSVLPYLQKFTFPEGSNTFKVPGVDETNRANGYRWGGVVVDVENEGIIQNYSWPRLKQTEFSAIKMIGLAPVTNELLADVDNLGAFLERAFADELRYKLEQYVLTSAGTGAGKPESVMNSAALVTAQATTQTSGTIIIENIHAMWSALPSASRKRAIWAGSESALAQAGASTFEPFYPPAGCTNPADTPRLMGRPAIETDMQPACGTPGDLLLIDPEWYGVCSKPMASAMSAHVFFLNDQVVFKIVWRVDAKPLVSAQITASDGTQRSPFVALAAR